MTTVPMLDVLKTLLATVPLVWVRVQSRAAITEFAEYRGLEELSGALLNVNDILRDLRLREPRKQTLINSFFD